jgi:hypothetical protein
VNKITPKFEEFPDFVPLPHMTDAFGDTVAAEQHATGPRVYAAASCEAVRDGLLRLAGRQVIREAREFHCGIRISHEKLDLATLEGSILSIPVVVSWTGVPAHYPNVGNVMSLHPLYPKAAGHVKVDVMSGGQPWIETDWDKLKRLWTEWDKRDRAGIIRLDPEP